MHRLLLGILLFVVLAWVIMMLFMNQRKQAFKLWVLSQSITQSDPTWCEKLDSNMCQTLSDYCEWDTSNPSMIQCKNK